MKPFVIMKTRRGLLLTLSVLALLTAVAILPYHFRSEAGGGKGGEGLLARTVSHDDDLPNYDIRADKRAFDKIAAFRNSSNRNASAIADTRDGFTKGEESLRTEVPSLKIVYNFDTRTPEVIAPDVQQGRAFLTGASRAKRSDVLVNFLKQNSDLVGASEDQISRLKVFSDYTNPDGNLSFVELNQEINGIPVFRGEVKAGFTKNGEIIRVITNLAPGLDYESLSTDFRQPLDAVRAAAGYIKYDLKAGGLARNDSASDNLKTVFGNGDWATTAEKMYFPTEPGVAVPAWRVLIWQPVNAFYIVVDAETGTMLWRKNITEDQTQSATYNVYTNPNAMINVADSPFPITPGPTSPNGTQGAGIPRTSITRIGNEAPYAFNNNGWITDGGNETDGNANEAGLDRDPTNGVDVVNGRAVGTSRTFNYPLNPFNPNTNTGDVPVPAGEPASGCAAIPQPHGMVDAQRAAVTQLFYISNWYHDEMYLLGFTEQARNFQNDNFGRGGVGADRVSAEAQDCSGTNNANFGTPADGGRGRMQMFLWTAPTPDIDGDLDADVIIHEYTHGLSNRLHGNGSGLSLNMSRGMGEGWSDFYGHAMLSEPSDPINGIYTTGAYDTYSPGGVNNSYYAIRRFPKAVMAFTGGPLNRPHNPMTFADIDATQQNLGDGAFAPRFVGTADQVHNAGEVWSSALWEVRARMVQRLGWATGNRLALQLVTDGMKLAPIGPTFLTERDAIIAAALASGTAADVADLWAGFAVRGMGASSSIQNVGTGAGDARVTEAFDLPNLLQTPVFAVSDATGDNDGFPEPGEPVALTIPLTNNTGNAATGVTLQVVGGGSANYGTINNASTVSQQVSYTIPAGTACGSALTLTFNVNSNLGATSFNRTIIIGSPTTTFTESFDGVTAPAFPAGWTVTSRYAPMTFVSTTNGPDTPANSAFAADLPTGTGGPPTDGGDTDLTSPAIPITAQAATVSFRHKYNTEPGWDGGVLEISVGGGAFQDILAAGGAFVSNGYNGSLGVSTPNALGGRAAWTGDSAAYATSIARLPASASGQNVQLRWRFGADNNTAPVGGGWNVDTIRVAGSYACSFTPNAVRSRADFDGDGKTDLSVFRPSEGNWYLNRSTSGFTVFNWGLSTDIVTPGDFDGDGKADTAVFRPSTGIWYILQSSNGAFSAAAFGSSGDIPVAGDYDGDLKTDVAVFRPSTNVWYILNSAGGTTITAFGAAGDIPIRADYNGDGKTDIAIFRAGQWWIANSGGPVTVTNFGLASDKPVPADYDGDNKDDVAVFRPSDGFWYILRSGNGVVDYVPFGLSGDIPVPGDYDGDGKDDQAVYRGGTWYLNRSTSGTAVAAFGLGSDIAVPTGYVP